MKTKLLLASIILTSLVIYSCTKENTEDDPVRYLIFGHYYGECVGESCIDIFCLETTRLLEDANDTYPSDNFYAADFYVLSEDKFNEVNGLMSFFPDTLLSINETTIGCPDCADGGGLYIEYNVDGIRRFWRIDQVKENVPSSLHAFMDEVNERIELINN